MEEPSRLAGEPEVVVMVGGSLRQLAVLQGAFEGVSSTQEASTLGDRNFLPPMTGLRARAGCLDKQQLEALISDYEKELTRRRLDKLSAA